MKTEIYEKPMLKFASLRNEETVAATCWGYGGTDTKLFCDIPGEGYVSFQIGNKKCSLDLINVIYYDGDGNTSNANQNQIRILEDILRKSGGESGNNYSGEGSTVLPDEPGNWS